MTKVVFVNRFFTPDQSATAQLLGDLACALAADGAEVVVVTSANLSNTANTRLPEFERLNGVAIHRLWSPFAVRSSLFLRFVCTVFFYLSAFFKLLRLLERGDRVVAKTDPPLISVPVAFAAMLRGADHFNWIQDVFPEIALALEVPLTKGLIGRVLAHVRDWSLRRARVNVVIGEKMADVISARGIARREIAIIPNWADGNMIRPLAHAQNHLRAQWGLGEKVVVGYSGNLGRVHDFACIIDAANELKDDARIVFLIIGSGARLDQVRQEASARGLQNVVFRPFQERQDLGSSLTLVDIHLVSLRPEMEGFSVPSKLSGISAAGRAAIFIGSPTGELADLLARFDSGCTVEPSDYLGLAEKIRFWADSPGAREETNLHARHLFESHFDQRLCIKKWLGVLGQPATESVGAQSEIGSHA